jgi:hypothetical protein
MLISKSARKGGQGGSLDAWAGEIKSALEHPDSILYLAGGVFGILAAGYHVQSGPAERIITKSDHLSRDSL